MSSQIAATPFFVASDGGQPLRRLLLVSHSFPPAPEVGALRWQKMGELAYERGWALDVIMHRPAQQLMQAAALAKVPQAARLFGVPLQQSVIERAQRALRRALAREPAGRSADEAPACMPESSSRLLARMARANRVALYYLAHRKWAHEAAALADRILSDEHAAVITSGPPHMAHVAGSLIARRHGLPFIMDMRDPWALASRTARELDSPLWWALARHFEREAVRAASLIVANTEMFRRALCHRYPDISERVLTVMNGSDDDQLPSGRRGDRFTVAYAGTLYWDRDPRPLFRAAAMVIGQLGLRPHQFAIEFMGEVRYARGMAVEEMARSEGVADYVVLHADGTREQALEFLARADVLVSLPLVTSRGAHDAGVDLTVPAKIFEYARFEAWLLALAERGSATEQFLRDTEADVVAPLDVDSIARVLLRRYRDRQGGLRPRPIDDGRFSRRTQSLRLLDALEAHVGSGRSPGAREDGSRDMALEQLGLSRS